MEKPVKESLIALVGLLVLGCQATPAGPLVLGEPASPRRVVGWRLVERTYAHADAQMGVAGDGVIPGESRLLVYEPVFEELRVREFGAIRVKTGCDHEIRLRIVGPRERAVGERVTSECLVDAPPALYHEIAVESTMGGIEVLEIKGGIPVAGRAGRYLVAGQSPFQVIFTSRVAGRGAVSITVVREVGGDDPGVRQAAGTPLPAHDR